MIISNVALYNISYLVSKIKPNLIYDTYVLMLEKSQLQNVHPSLSLYNYMKIYNIPNARFKVKVE